MSDVEAGEPLPSYNDTRSQSPNAPPMYIPPDGEETPVVGSTAPPTYDSIFGRIKGAKEEHGNSFGFVKALFTIVGAAIGGVVCVALAGVLLAFPVAQLVIGIQNQDECTINDKIPLYLIVAGGAGVAAIALQMLDCLCCNSSGEGESGGNPCLKFIVQILNLFCTAWFICGNVWVYKAHKTVIFDDAESEFYCSKLVYLFSFWSITSVYICIGASCVLGCGCVCIMACCFGGK